MNDYDTFIQSKLRKPQVTGFTRELPLNKHLFDWQIPIIEWAIKRGRAALFKSTGTGKTLDELEWCRHVSHKTGLPTLICCPLVVAAQHVREGKKFGIEAKQVREPGEIVGGINVVNYDRVQKFESIEFGGVALDESSCLRDFQSKTRRYLTDRFSGTPYRLACTATPAPNDFEELGQQAEFLGIITRVQMLATWFINDTKDTGTWRLKKHAVDAFWKWVSSWAIGMTLPSDIGFSDDGFILPPLNLIPVWVDVDERGEKGSGQLLRADKLSAMTFHREMRLTMNDRIKATKEIIDSKPDEPWAIWCNIDVEQRALEKALKGKCISVFGSLNADEKEKRILRWLDGELPYLVTKASICGRGMNFQHCPNIVYWPTFSFEDYHQTIRRFWRFGQTKPVNCYVVLPKTADNVMQSIERKMEQHETMRQLVKFSREALDATLDKPVVINKEIKTEMSENWTSHLGDAVRVAREKLKDQSVGFSVFSPPFADLFTYSDDAQDMGNCTGLEEFMKQFGFLIDEFHRVMMPGREVAVHCCDLLATKWKHGAIEFQDFSGEIARAFRARGFLLHSRITIWKSPVVEQERTKAHGLLQRTMLKDSTCARVGSPDYLLVFRKRGVNPNPVKHTKKDFPLEQWQEWASPVWMTVDQGNVMKNFKTARGSRDERHIAPLQIDVINRALTLWSNKGDLVYSPFSGIASEGYCSVKMGRKFIGSELKPEYWTTGLDNLRRADDEAMDLFNR